MSSPSQQRNGAQLTLDNLHVGEKGTIVRVGGRRELKRRFLDMGLIRGEMVQVRAVAPLGDPMSLAIKGYRLSLRREEARNIIVEVAPKPRDRGVDDPPGRGARAGIA
jgi:ferrous iron transport protein A